MKWFLIIRFAWGALAAWEFPHQPHYGQTQQSMTLDSQDDVDINIERPFNGLATYAGVSYVDCFTDSTNDEEKYDIAIMGAPFDTVSITTCIRSAL